MKQQYETEPNMTELPEIYSTMPNNWQKWTPVSKNRKQRNLLKWLGFLPLGDNPNATVFGPKMPHEGDQW